MWRRSAPSIPAANVLALPFLFRSFDHLHKVLDRQIGEEILAGFQRHGFVGLTFYDSGARSIYNSVRPIRTLADMKGLRIRIQQSELMVEHDQGRSGPSPVELPYGQVLTGLRPGSSTARRTTGRPTSPPAITSTPPYYTLTEHTMGPEVLVMSMRAWESLSGRGPGDLPRTPRASRASSCASIWLGLEERSRQQARDERQYASSTNFDRKPFETGDEFASMLMR